jgi:hypothetical protein
MRHSGYEFEPLVIILNCILYFAVIFKTLGQFSSPQSFLSAGQPTLDLSQKAEKLYCALSFGLSTYI